MDIDTNFCVVLTTTNDLDEADRLAAGLVSNQLAACVQITEITSHYVWKGAAVKENEYLMILKTRSVLYPKIEAFILSEHRYETPELILLPIESGFEKYLEWITERTRPVD
jgi:periplasmic divalent cation tolerance protein